MTITRLLAGFMLCIVAAFAHADTEDVFWESVVKSNAREEYQLYLKHYPNGRYASAARRMLEATRENPRPQAEPKPQPQAEAAKRAAEQARKREAERRQAEADAERQRVAREAERLRAEQEALRPGRVFRDCADCPEMVVIPAGSFDMGSNNGDADERPEHSVRIGRAFALAKTEVTQAQWRALMGNNPSRFSGCDNCPVETVNWNDAQDFVRRLNQKTGRTYRLPSEAEWEYACRAGNRQEYCGGENVDVLAWHTGNSNGRTQAVAGRQPNAWGLYDMSGNVWEWTEDCGNGSYNGAPSDGSAWTSGNCGARVLRGGSWSYFPRFARAAVRYGLVTTFRDYYFGFRLARILP